MSLTRLSRLFSSLNIFFVIILISAGLAASFFVAHPAGPGGGPESGYISRNGGPNGDSGSAASYPVSFLNDRARDISGAAAANAPGFLTPAGLTGRNQIVAVADSGLDDGTLAGLHPDLQSEPGRMPKVVLLRSWAGRDLPDDPSGHGTHMAATIAGTGAASGGKFRGVAPGASIYFQAILDRQGRPAPPADLADLFWPAYSAGARIHVNGWGGGPNTYLNPSVQVDSFVRGHPDFLVIFGAGNSGPAARSITAEANSKNALVVGASVLPRPAFVPGADDTLAAADFSSRGPAGDGRIKPELLAPASAVISARSSMVGGNLPGYPEYTRLQGTSMAAAVTGGSAALLREYFKDHLALSTPSAALFRAALANGARPGADGPGRGGFGVLDLAGTVIALQEETFLLDDSYAGLVQGETLQYTFNVTDSTTPFKATLAWTDPPNEPGSVQALVNDIDLVVRAPGGRVYHGNHFLGANAPDRVNNIEQVYLPAPVPGEYTVTVSGSAVRRNAVRGSSEAAQDFALVWGQPVATGTVLQVEGKLLVLTGGKTIDTERMPLVSLVNGSVAQNPARLLPGASVYHSPQRAYLAATLWQAAGIRAIKTAEGTILTEMHPSTRLGGYILAPDAAVILNNQAAAPGELPPAFEVSAVISPLDQQARQVRAGARKTEGVVAHVSLANGKGEIYLAGDQRAYRISAGTVFSYEESYEGVAAADLPFGTGSLDELEQVMPGMFVRLNLAPSTGDVQYLAVKRQVVLGTVSGIDARTGTVSLASGETIRLLSGAPVKKDRKNSELAALRPGDHASAVLLPDTGEAIGLVAYSSVIYGKVIDYVEKSRTLYLLDDDGRYLSLNLPGDAVIYRWGLRAAPGAVASGCRVRVTTDTAVREAWRLDIADTVKDTGILTHFDAASGTVRTEEGGRFQTAGFTQFSKNGFTVPPQALRPGERVELEYTAAPAAGGSVLFTVSAATPAPPPLLHSSAVALPGRLVVTGRAGPANRLYLWWESEWRELAVDSGGRFELSLPLENQGGSNAVLAALDPRTGGVAGSRIAAVPAGRRGIYESAVLDALTGALARINPGTLPDRSWTGRLPAAPLTRVEAVTALARLLNWPAGGQAAPAFTDTAAIPAHSRPAVAGALARGIVKGHPGGYFLPQVAITRAEAAVMLAAVLRDLGLAARAPAVPAYADATAIPHWAAAAVAETTAAGLFRGRPAGEFSPHDPLTADDMAVLLDRLLGVIRDHFGG